jgi:transposase
MPQETLSTKEAAEILEVSDQTIINWWKEGIIEGYKLNPSKSNSPIRVSKKRIEKILGERTKPQNQPSGK